MTITRYVVEYRRPKHGTPEWDFYWHFGTCSECFDLIKERRREALFHNTYEFRICRETTTVESVVIDDCKNINSDKANQ